MSFLRLSRRRLAEYRGPALVQTGCGGLYRPSIALERVNPFHHRSREKLLRQFNATGFDSDVFWEEINETISFIHESLLTSQFQHVLNEMDQRNKRRMAFWIGTLYQTDSIEKYGGGTIRDRGEQLFNMAAISVENAKELLTDMKLKDMYSSLILSDQIEVELVDGMWLISVYYLNCDELGGVPDFFATKSELDDFCANAELLIPAHLKQITFSYDPIESGEFVPELFQLWSLAHNNPKHTSKPRCTPMMSTARVVPIIPANIDFE